MLLSTGGNHRGSSNHQSDSYVGGASVTNLCPVFPEEQSRFSISVSTRGEENDICGRINPSLIALSRLDFFV
jgi:hypothetical protein